MQKSTGTIPKWRTYQTFHNLKSTIRHKSLHEMVTQRKTWPGDHPLLKLQVLMNSNWAIFRHVSKPCLQAMPELTCYLVLLLFHPDQKNPNGNGTSEHPNGECSDFAAWLMRFSSSKVSMRSVFLSTPEAPEAMHWETVRSTKQVFYHLVSSNMAGWKMNHLYL